MDLIINPESEIYPKIEDKAYYLINNHIVVQSFKENHVYGKSKNF